MSEKPSTAREALLAELLGDMQAALTRFELADQSAKATAEAITAATAQYRVQVDEMVEKLRTETAAIMIKTTEHAAKSLVGQQQATLQKAALLAMQQALGATVLRRTRRDWLLASAVGAASAAAATALLLVTVGWFTTP